MAWPQEIINIRRGVEEAPSTERGETGGARRKGGIQEKARRDHRGRKGPTAATGAE